MAPPTDLPPWERSKASKVPKANRQAPKPAADDKPAQDDMDLSNAPQYQARALQAQPKSLFGNIYVVSGAIAAFVILGFAFVIWLAATGSDPETSPERLEATALMRTHRNAVRITYESARSMPTRFTGTRHEGGCGFNADNLIGKYYTVEDAISQPRAGYASFRVMANEAGHPHAETTFSLTDPDDYEVRWSR
jgi:hypothetical protein